MKTIIADAAYYLLYAPLLYYTMSSDTRYWRKEV